MRPLPVPESSARFERVFRGREREGGTRLSARTPRNRFAFQTGRRE